MQCAKLDSRGWEPTRHIFAGSERTGKPCSSVFHPPFSCAWMGSLITDLSLLHLRRRIVAVRRIHFATTRSAIAHGVQVGCILLRFSSRPQMHPSSSSGLSPFRSPRTGLPHPWCAIHTPFGWGSQAPPSLWNWVASSEKTSPSVSATCEPTRTRGRWTGEKGNVDRSNPNAPPIETGRNPSSMDEPEGAARRGSEGIEPELLCRRRSVRGGFEPHVVARCGRGRHTAHQTDTSWCDKARQKATPKTHIVQTNVLSLPIPRRIRAGGTVEAVQGVAKGSSARGWIPTQANRIYLRTKPWKNSSCRC